MVCLAGRAIDMGAVSEPERPTAGDAPVRTNMLIRSSSSLFPLPRVFPSVFRKPGSVYQDRLGTRSSLARESDSFAINKGRCLFLGRYRRGFGSPAETVWEHTDDFAGDVY